MRKGSLGTRPGAAHGFSRTPELWGGLWAQAQSRARAGAQLGLPRLICRPLWGTERTAGPEAKTSGTQVLPHCGPSAHSLGSVSCRAGGPPPSSPTSSTAKLEGGRARGFLKPSAPHLLGGVGNIGEPRWKPEEGYRRGVGAAPKGLRHPTPSCLSGLPEFRLTQNSANPAPVPPPKYPPASSGLWAPVGLSPKGVPSVSVPCRDSWPGVSGPQPAPETGRRRGRRGCQHGF